MTVPKEVKTISFLDKLKIGEKDAAASRAQVCCPEEGVETY